MYTFTPRQRLALPIKKIFFLCFAFFGVFFGGRIMLSFILDLFSGRAYVPLESAEGAVMGVSDIDTLMRTSSLEEGVFTKEYVIAEGDVPADIFLEYGNWGANDVVKLLGVATEIYDLTSLKIGRNIRFFYDTQSGDKAVRMEYDRDTEEMIVVNREGEDFLVEKIPIAYEVSQERADIVIDSFLYMDALDAGITEATIIELADVFAYAIDFTTEIRQGDEATLIYEKRYRNGERGPDGRIKVARFRNDGKEHFAYYFEHDGEGGYYDGEGHAIVRQFLKAPLSYSRITSGYTGARMHPITRTVSAHYQIDYAAPIGTPVVSTARGTVTSAGWENGWGYIVRVTHDNGYTTHYAHLSSFATGIRSGTRVAQGQLVGYVGSTGWSTGPHLDYGMRFNGAPVNPLTLDQPKGPPLEGASMEAFQKMREEYQGQL